MSQKNLASCPTPIRRESTGKWHSTLSKTFRGESRSSSSCWGLLLRKQACLPGRCACEQLSECDPQCPTCVALTEKIPVKGGLGAGARETRNNAGAGRDLIWFPILQTSNKLGSDDLPRDTQIVTKLEWSLGLLRPSLVHLLENVCHRA